MADNNTNDYDDDNDDILGDLLANDSEPESDETPKTVLKELDFNFVDVSDKLTNETSELDEQKQTTLLLDRDDSSDDDNDKKYFEEQKYSESGRFIKNLLKTQESDKHESPNIQELSKCKSSVVKNISSGWDIKKKVENNTFTKSPELKKKESINTKDNGRSGPLTKWLNKPSDIYTDPVFGLRIVTPVVSYAELKERMSNRTAVTVSKIKHFISTQNLDNDWAIAGVLIQRSATKKSQSGNQYCIWTISDLTENVNRVTIFLFKNAYKTFWKTAEGTVVGVLNPSILESRNEKDQATLSVDVAQKIMILGNSKDIGKCKSTKKSGEPCGNIINISKCEYCIYHVKQEYNKASRRPDLQTDVNNRRFANTFGTKPKSSTPGIYSQGNHINMLAIPAKRNLKMEQKDSERLAMLTGKVLVPQKSSDDKIKEETKRKACMVELSSEQAKKDLSRLNKMRGWNSTKSLLSLTSNSETTAFSSSLKPTSTATAHEKKPATGLATLSIPRLGLGMKGGSIDFSEPIPKKRVNLAKMNAINWVKENGGIKQSNPNQIAQSREKIEATSKKRRIDDEEEMPKAKKTNSISETFKELLAVNSAHTDLIEKNQEDEKEKYFNKLEAKERMEEKMMNTFKVECKAVTCLICKYTAFSASDMCKEKRHPLRVTNAMKSFFKCSDCGNRTVSLDRIPSQTCKKCGGSNWLRSAMMDEKRLNIPSATLSIRGGEQKFMGSDTTDTNLNLLVPE